MINTEKLQEIIKVYKQQFEEIWKEEKYKWEAVWHFQKHWDIHAEDFGAMFQLATEKTLNLLVSNNFYPRGMMLDFIKVDVEAVRGMFINLYDESKGLEERVEAFQQEAERLRSTYGDEIWGSHYQNTNTISIYLWLRFPEKYYIYKYSECVKVANELESDFIPKRNGSARCMIEAYGLYDEICRQLQQDSEIKEMLCKAIDANCYVDTQLKTMTTDIGFFISRSYAQQVEENTKDWFPKDYNPGLSVEEWVELLNDPDIFTMSSLEIMKRMKDYGCMATCAQLAAKYGKSATFYNSVSSALAKRIAKKTGCSLLTKDNENSKWWPILYVGRKADKGCKGIYIWKLREELDKALDEVDLAKISLYADEEGDKIEKNYWWLNASPKVWSFSDISIGEVQSYTLYNDNGNKRRIFQNFLDAKEGDMVIGYESNPVKQIVAIARVAQENDGENLYFEKVEELTTPIDYIALKACPELEKMEYFVNAQGSLFKLTKDEYDFIMDVIRESNPSMESDNPVESYGKRDFLNEVYMPEERYDTLVGLIKNKKNLILQGAPGVGKTFAAKRLAYTMMGEIDEERIKFIQFHQNYSYEDFIMGYRPQGDGFKLTNGVFYQFCQMAANHPDKDYYFIIDEINRGNMSKIFGELLMLIEKDYRGTKATLAYSGKLFSVPKNLYIIGMMNTADRSLAMLDYALRRRFSFFEMEPGFNSEGFKAYQEELNNETFNTLIERIKELNKEIELDDSLGSGFCIGHSYFCGQEICNEEWMKQVVYYDIIPMLQEYWFDDKEKLKRWENKLSGVFND